MITHPTHCMRSTMDSSFFDEVCDGCGATDAPGHRQKLRLPCLRPVESEREDRGELFTTIMMALRNKREALP